MPKYFLRGGVDAVAALAEVDGVEVPLDYLVLVVLLLELGGLEDLYQLALHGDFLVAGEVLYELLGDGGAAEGVVAAGEHGEHGTDGAVPVHALVLIEAVVLDGDEGLDEVVGDVLEVDPDAVFGAVERGELLIFSGAGLAVDDARLRELIVGERDVYVLGEAGLDIESEHAGEQQRGRKYYEEDGDNYLSHEADGADDGIGGRIRGLSGVKFEFGFFVHR